MADIVDVWHHRTDGYHKFTSPQVPGLYMIGEDKDVDEIFEEIPILIAALVKADFGFEVSVSREGTCALYREITEHMPGPAILHFSVARMAN